MATQDELLDYSFGDDPTLYQDARFIGDKPINDELAELPDLYEHASRTIKELPVYSTPLHKADKSGLIQTFGKGVASGIAGLGEALGGALHGMTDADYHGEIESYWGAVADSASPDEDLRGKTVMDDPSIALDPRWWAHGLGQIVPSLVITTAGAGVGAGVAGVRAGVGAKTGIQTLFSGRGLDVAKTLTSSPERLVASAKLGAKIGGGLAGGSQEGLHTASEIFERGGNKMEAGMGFVGSTAFSGILNSISLGAMLEPEAFQKVAFNALVARNVPKEAARPMATSAAVMMGGLTEGFTEYLENPTNAAVMILADSVVDTENRFIEEGYGPLIAESFKQVDEFLLSMVPGMGGSALSFRAKKKYEDKTLHVQEGSEEIAPVEGDEAVERTIEERQLDAYPHLRESEERFDNGPVSYHNVDDDSSVLGLLSGNVKKRVGVDLKAVPDNRHKSYLKAAAKTMFGESTNVVFAEMTKDGAKSRVNGFSSGDVVVINTLAKDPMQAILSHELKHRVDVSLRSESEGETDSFTSSVFEYIDKVTSGEIEGVDPRAYDVYASAFGAVKAELAGARQVLDREIPSDALAAVMNDPRFWAELATDKTVVADAFEKEAMNVMESMASGESKPVFDQLVGFKTDGVDTVKRAVSMARSMRDASKVEMARNGELSDDDFDEYEDVLRVSEILKDRGIIGVAEGENLIDVQGVNGQGHQIVRESGTLGTTQKGLVHTYMNQREAERPGMPENLDALAASISDYLSERHSMYAPEMSEADWNRKVSRMVRNLRKLDANNWGVKPEGDENNGRQILEVFAERLILGRDASMEYWNKLKEDTHAGLDIEFSVSAEQDDAYSKAVADGNIEAADALVSEVANNAGYSKAVFHGTEAEFREFDLEHKPSGIPRSMVGLDAIGHWFSENPTAASTFGSRVVSGVVRAESPLVFETHDQFMNWAEGMARGHADTSESARLRGLGIDPYVSMLDAEALRGRLREGGKDSIHIKSSKEMIELGAPLSESGIWLVLNSEQVKSAEPITYDESGNVIPLSERFDSSTDDINFSIDASDGFEADIQTVIGSSSYPNGRKVVPKLVQEIVANYTSKVDHVRRGLNLHEKRNQMVVKGLYALTKYLETHPDFDGTNHVEIMAEAQGGKTVGKKKVGKLTYFGRETELMAKNLFTKTDPEQAADFAISARDDRRVAKGSSASSKANVNVREGIASGRHNAPSTVDAELAQAAESMVEPIYKQDPNAKEVLGRVVATTNGAMPKSEEGRARVAESMAKAVQRSIRAYKKPLSKLQAAVSARHTWANLGDGIADTGVLSRFRLGERNKRNADAKAIALENELLETTIYPPNLSPKEKRKWRARSHFIKSGVSVNNEVAASFRLLMETIADPERSFKGSLVEGSGIETELNADEMKALITEKLDPKLKAMFSGEIEGDAEGTSKLKKILRSGKGKATGHIMADMEPVTTKDLIKMAEFTVDVFQNRTAPLVRVLQVMNYAEWWRKNEGKFMALQEKAVDGKKGDKKRFEAIRKEQERVLPSMRVMGTTSSGKKKETGVKVDPTEVLAAYQVFVEAGEAGKSHADSISAMKDHLEGQTWGTRKNYYLSKQDKKTDLLDQLATATGLEFTEQGEKQARAKSFDPTGHIKSRESDAVKDVEGSPIDNMLEYYRKLELQVNNFELVNRLGRDLKTAQEMGVLSKDKKNKIVDGLTKNLTMLYGYSPYQASGVASAALKFNSFFWKMYPFSISRAAWFSGRNIANQGTLAGGMLKEFEATDVTRAHVNVFTPLLRNRLPFLKENEDVPRAMMLARNKYNDDFIEKHSIKREHGLNQDVLAGPVHTSMIDMETTRRIDDFAGTLMSFSDDFNRYSVFTTALQIGENLIKEVHSGALDVGGMFKRLKAQNMHEQQALELQREFEVAHENFQQSKDVGAYDGFLGEFALVKNENVNFSYQTAGKAIIEQDPNNRWYTGIMTFQRGTAEQFYFNGIRPIKDAIDIYKRGGKINDPAAMARLREAMRGVGMHAFSHWLTGVGLAVLMGEKLEWGGEEDEYATSLGWATSMTYSPVSPGASVAADVTTSAWGLFGALFNGDAEDVQNYAGRLGNRALWFVPMMNDFRNIAESVGNVQGVSNVDMLEAMMTDSTIEGEGDEVERSLASFVQHVLFGTQAAGDRELQEILYESLQIPGLLEPSEGDE